ncbi:MAG: ABC transporter [Gammaproteobacteria bacterium]|nr:ABC transporter [Gammaproteobacteria bacterium]|tara:strand:- start:1293 stop:3101 length:1809 start_codon:yes stop_codon:yes gene_type:complete
MTDTKPEHREKGSSVRPLRMLLPFVAPYKGTVVLAIGALLISSAALLAMPMAVRNVIDHGFSVENAANVDRYFFVLLLFSLVIGFFGAARSYFVNWLGERVVADIRDQVFQHVIKMDAEFFEVTKTGEVLSRLTTDTTLIQSISGVGLSIVLRSSIQFVGSLFLLAYTNLKLMGILLLIFPFVVTPVILLGRWLRQLSRETQDRVADASGHASEVLNAVEVVQAFTAEVLESERFGKAIASSFRTAVKRTKVRALFSTVATTCVFGSLIFVLWVGAQGVLAGEITGGELGQFVLYSMFVAVSAGMLTEMWGEVQRAAGAMERLSVLLTLTPTIRAPADPAEFPEQSVGSICFESVSFSYPSRPDLLAVDEFSLDIAPGENIAFVGPSGAGKSTLFQLLLRFFNPTSGRILIDGVDITLAAPEDVRKRLGIVPQETIVFGANAAENIRFGRPDAADEQVMAAARAASAHEFIEQLENGYDTFLGEKGARLSGGQKQRIAIARAILKDPPILLLDEATSSLDAENERLVQAALEFLQKDRTTIVVAHRLATVLHADRIVVIDQGQILDVGRHAELIERNSMYSRMVRLQFGNAHNEEPQLKSAV